MIQTMALVTICSSASKTKSWFSFNFKCLEKIVVCYFSSKSGNNDNNSNNNSNKQKNSKNCDNNNCELPEPPTNCCMSGCANCVYLDYAEQLTKLFNDSGEKSQQIILSKISDPNLKAFLRTELTIKNNKKKK